MIVSPSVECPVCLPQVIEHYVIIIVLRGLLENFRVGYIAIKEILY